MKGDRDVIAMLNGVLKNKLTAINQYCLHAKMLKNRGLKELGAYEYKESIGENVEVLLRTDLKTEDLAMPMLRSGIALCEKSGDYINRERLEDILESEEEHIDFIETPFNLIGQMGLQNHIQRASGGVES